MRTLVDCLHLSAPLGSSRMPARVNFTDAGVAFDADGALAPAAQLVAKLRLALAAGALPEGGTAPAHAPARERQGGDSRGPDAAVDPHGRRRARRALQHAPQGLCRTRGAGLRDDAPRLGHPRTPPPRPRSTRRSSHLARTA